MARSAPPPRTGGSSTVNRTVEGAFPTRHAISRVGIPADFNLITFRTWRIATSSGISRQVGKLPPHHGVEKAARRPDHDRRRALPRISERPDAITPARAMNSRTDHWSGRLNFISIGGSRRLTSSSLAFSSSAAASAASRSPRRGRAEIERLHLFQPIAKLVFDPHALAPRKQRGHRTNRPSTAENKPSTHHRTGTRLRGPGRMLTAYRATIAL
ncbi:hypothetical protein ABIF29_005558 [Bradyrhizobium elkanii]|uniref:Uncharacterized protein n=1 Tax=Bradyrhizobium elkanii TaxID=29448 RepID=A0ABV4F5N4_BRAEL